MTDIPAPLRSVPARLGVRGRVEGDQLLLDLLPQPEILHHGVIRASVLSFLVDVVAGVPMDGDTEVWTLTTDMSMRVRPVPAPPLVTAAGRVLRAGRRSFTTLVDLTSGTGELVGTGVIGFAHVPRKPTDPPKHRVTPAMLAQGFDGTAFLEGPLREEAGIEVLDAAAGVVEVALVPELLNPAGTLQGAMVALVAEVAAEELMAARSGRPVVVTELDLRYLTRTGAGPVRTRARVIETGPDPAVEISLVDTSTDTVTTLVLARTAPVDGS